MSDHHPTGPGDSKEFENQIQGELCKKVHMRTQCDLCMISIWKIVN